MRSATRSWTGVDEGSIRCGSPIETLFNGRERVEEPGLVRCVSMLQRSRAVSHCAGR